MSEGRYAANAERTEEVVCDACAHAYPVVVRTSSAVTGPMERADELQAQAQREADEGLRRFGAMESCPACGAYPQVMVRRIFQDPLHAVLKRRHDGSFAAVNAPFARVRRLAGRGKSGAEIEALLASEIEQLPLLWDVVQAVVSGEIGEGAEGDTEGEILAHHLAIVKSVEPAQVREALVKIAGLDDALAHQVVERLTTDVERRESSVGYLLGGIAVLGLGAIVAFYLGIVRPMWRSAEESAAATARKEANRKALQDARKPVSWTMHEATDGVVTLKVGVAPDGRHKLVVGARRVKQPETRVAKLIVNGEVVAQEYEHSKGDPEIEVTDLSEASFYVPGEPQRITVVAQIGELLDWETGREESWLAKGSFEVTFPRTGPDGPELSGPMVKAMPRTEESAADRVAEAVGAAALARLDATLFGKPRDEAATLPAASMTDMDRDIRRAALKEAANGYLGALSLGDAAGASAHVAPEDAGAHGAEIAALAGEGFAIGGATYREATVDASGTGGRVKCSFLVDHDEGTLKREGQAVWSFRDDRWWFDPLP